MIMILYSVLFCCCWNHFHLSSSSPSLVVSSASVIIQDSASQQRVTAASALFDTIHNNSNSSTARLIQNSVPVALALTAASASKDAAIQFSATSTAAAALPSPPPTTTTHSFSISNLLVKTCTAVDDESRSNWAVVGCVSHNNNDDDDGDNQPGLSLSSTTPSNNKKTIIVRNARCNIYYGRCACVTGYEPNVNGTACITTTAGAALEAKVSGTSNNNDNINTKMTTRISSSSTNALKDLVQKTPMLPILVVLVSMFICMCIVLQLFAKARFRNTSRSIFANPQKLELAKAQERRMSQLSQLSGGAAMGTGWTRTPNYYNRRATLTTLAYNNNHLQNSNNRLGSISTTRSARSSLSSATIIIGPAQPPPTTTSTWNGPLSSTKTTSFVNSFDHLNHSGGDTSSVIVKAKSRSNSISSSKLF